MYKNLITLSQHGVIDVTFGERDLKIPERRVSIRSPLPDRREGKGRKRAAEGGLGKGNGGAVAAVWAAAVVSDSLPSRHQFACITKVADGGDQRAG